MGIWVVGCGSPDEITDPIPFIELEEINVIKNSANKDSIIEISLYFEDGDGDIGLSESDTIPPFDFGSPYFHNLPVTYLVERSGSFEELINPTNGNPYGNNHQRIPVLTPTGKNKTISGILTVKLAANPLNTKPERVKFEIRLIDRKLNISNMIETEPLDLSH